METKVKFKCECGGCLIISDNNPQKNRCSLQCENLGNGCDGAGFFQDGKLFYTKDVFKQVKPDAVLGEE